MIVSLANLFKFTFCHNCILEGSFSWMVPVSISTASDPKKAAVVTLLDKTSMDVIVPNVTPDQWVKVGHSSQCHPRPVG